ncbi:MAG: hypothetical protein SGJ03_06145 [Alphaproteobacteria bacterium]|nr:hypothetical protein [Alphaproteobacteria bacterium]
MILVSLQLLGTISEIDFFEFEEPLQEFSRRVLSARERAFDFQKTNKSVGPRKLDLPDDFWELEARVVWNQCNKETQGPSGTNAEVIKDALAVLVNCAFEDVGNANRFEIRLYAVGDVVVRRQDAEGSESAKKLGALRMATATRHITVSGSRWV